MKKTKKTKAKSKSKKYVVVNKKFLLDLANKIYDPKKKTFLRLCSGELQNGPDPTNKKRPMHCGLGELYFEMTGRQPEDDSVDESCVVDKAVELSTLNTGDNDVTEAKKAIKKLPLSADMMDHLLYCVENFLSDFSDEESDFRDILDSIPTENDDDDCEDNVCTEKDYQSRSKRVAAKLREAAKVLPK